jgi:hypothetical protein
VLKWKLMLTTLPYVLVVAAIKVVMRYVIKYDGALEFGDVGVVLTGGVFLTGFLLTGVMADYKESEKLPGELAATLETLEELLLQANAAKPSVDTLPYRKGLLALVDDLRAWLFKKSAEPFSGLTRFRALIEQLERDGGGAYASKALSELHNLRKSVTRMSVISRTGFLPPAYALLETLLGLILLLVLGAKYKSATAEMVLVPFVALIYIYMLRLIRDVDDPFDYSADGHKRGGAEVELVPLAEYRERLAARLDAK